VEVFDSLTARRHRMSGSDCAFGYRTSVFKRESDRFVVLSVQFRLRPGSLSAPIAYAELAAAPHVEGGGSPPLAETPDVWLALRRSKGMVLDSADHDTWSVGSFFTNPILDDERNLPANAPRWSQPNGGVKTSAAWLIEQAGFGKGFGADIGQGRVRLSDKHTL